MSTTVAVIPPPHVVIGLVPGDRSERGTLVAVCRLIMRAGAAFAGRAEVVHSDAVPSYEFVSDLAEQLDTIHPARLTDLEARHTLRVWFRHPKAGPISVSYGPARSSSSHPITVTVSGASFDGWTEVKPTLAVRQHARAVREFVTRVFTLICDELAPVYAAIQVEDALPAPADLLDEGASVGTILFVSDPVIDAAPHLAEQLTALFKGTTWRGPKGLIAIDSSLLDPSQPRTINAVTRGRAGARLLGQALSAGPP